MGQGETCAENRTRSAGIQPQIESEAVIVVGTRIYKIVDAESWADARLVGEFTGAPIDHADGFIHFSAAEQVRETAARHFRGRTGLMLVAFDADDFGSTLKWERSRGDALFPHLYASLDPMLAHAENPLPVGPDGRHVFPAGIP